MRVITKEEFMLESGRFIEHIKKGAVFVYPTDTIYGIGCNALNHKAVARIRESKKRLDAPFSVIAPSKEWIIENCEVGEEAKKWLEKLPGPYTLILKLKNKRCVADSVIPGTSSIGVRIPDHWTTKIASRLNAPIVTTSVNESGKMFMTSLDNMDPSIQQNVDFMIDEGEKKGMPSNVIYLNEIEVSIKDRQTYPYSKKKI